MYSIIPTVSGSWRFVSSVPLTGGTPDPYGRLRDKFGPELIRDDDGGGNRQFSITYDLVAGRRYFLEVSDWSPSGTGTYQVTAIAPEPPVILVSPDSWVFPSSGGAKVIQVTSNVAWRLALPSWITAVPASGTGNATVTLTARPSTSDAPYSDVVLLLADGQRATMTVTQPARPAQPVDCGGSIIMITACTWSDLGTPIVGTMETPGDSDVYRFTPAVTGTWTFVSSPTPTGGISDPFGVIYAPNGGMIAYDDNSAGNRQFSLTVTLQAGTTYSLMIAQWPPGSTGGYVVTASRA